MKNGGQVPVSKKGKKATFTPLQGKDGKDAMRPGRHPCTCEASIHELVGNCLNCGRIVCKQEDRGPCFTCDREVIPMTERHLLRIQQKEALEQRELNAKNEVVRRSKTEKAQPGLKNIAKHFEKALAHKDKLLDYERHSERRTKVVDDEQDYFEIGTHHWMSSEKREEVKEQLEDLHQRKHTKARNLVLDLGSGQVSERITRGVTDLKAEVAKIEEGTDLKSEYQTIDAKALQLLKGSDLAKPVYVPSVEKNNRLNGKSEQRSQAFASLFADSYREWLNPLQSFRVQDSALTRMSDDGYCLSIRQPFASFLVHGIKLHEGRNWYTPYRGRLWIHSTAKPVDDSELESAKKLFQFISGVEQFPSTYPTGSLLGCVTLDDCLVQEEYRIQFQHGYVDDAYTFICEHPMKLDDPIPMNGKAKLFKLPGPVLKAATKQLRL